MKSRSRDCVAPNCLHPVVAGLELCVEHLAQSAARRGGWISAHRRAQAKAGGGELDASMIVGRGKVGAGGIWVGAQPPRDQALPAFGVLILCAYEIQPRRPEIAFAGRIIHCPLGDGPPPTPTELGRAYAASLRCAEEVRAGKSVLVTCAQGINRSAFVAALALLRLTKMDGAQVIEQIRRQRYRDCLFNPHFRRVIETFASSPRRA